MSVKTLPVIILLFLLMGCQSEEMASVSRGGATSSSPASQTDTAPTVFNFSLPALSEETESGWIFLSYIDPDGDQATRCEVFNRKFLTVTSLDNSGRPACLCEFGLCMVKVKPTENYFGSVSFDYSITAGNMTSTPGRVSFSVTGTDERPVAHERSFSLFENTSYVSNGTLSFPHLSGLDLDGDALTCTKVTDPSHGIVVVNSDCSFSYTPITNYEGNDSFSFLVNDGVSNSEPATVSIEVLRQNEGVIANDSSFSTYQNTSQSFTFSVIDPDSDPLEFFITTGPANGTLSGSGATRTYTPRTNFTGTDTFSFYVSDGQLISNTATVTVTVLTRTIFLRTTGNDSTGTINDPSRPFATAQAAANAASSFAPTSLTPIVIDIGPGSFGDLNFTSNFGQNISWRGAGASSSFIGNITANGVNGADGTASGDPSLGDYDGENATNAPSITIASNLTLTFGDVTANGGNGGVHAPDTITFSAYPGEPGAGGALILTGIFGTITARGGDGHGGGQGGSVNLRAGSTSSAINVSGGVDLCTIPLSCGTARDSGPGGSVTVGALATVNGDIISKGGANNGVEAAGARLAGAGGSITIFGTVNGSILADGGDTFDSEVGAGGRVDVSTGAVVTGNIRVLPGTFSNNGEGNSSGFVSVSGSAQDVIAHVTGAIGAGGEVEIRGTVRDIFVNSNTSSCSDSMAGSVSVFAGGTASNVYAQGGNSACSTAGSIRIYGTVTGTATVDGGDSSSSLVPGVGGSVIIGSTATVNIVHSRGGDALTCNPGGNGGTISVLTGATFNISNFNVTGGIGSCTNSNGTPGTITVN